MSVSAKGYDNLTERERLKDLKARYVKYVDRGRWDLLAGLYTEDTVFDIRTKEAENNGEAPIQGIQEVISFIQVAIGAGKCLHLVYAPEFRFKSENLAEVEWGLEYMAGQVTGGKFEGIHGYGHSLDVYQNINGIWRVKSVKLIRMFELSK